MNASAHKWEHFGHVSDIGVRGFGADPATAFAHAALALTAIITPLAHVVPATPVDIECSDNDLELLFVDWLNAILFEMATRHMLFSHFDVHIAGAKLCARIWGEVIKPEQHQPAVEVKAATYCELKVREQTPGLWLAQCVVDTRDRQKTTIGFGETSYKKWLDKKRPLLFN